jgi:hypothetical protein
MPRIGSYELVDRLGAGSQGEVYHARHVRLRRDVALKVLIRGADVAATQRFLREMRVAAALSHPNIVTVLDGGMDEDRPYYVMELVEGSTLDKRLLVEAPLPIALAVEMAAGLASGLDCLHTHGILHRDIKPANILWAKSNVLKLADFGLCLPVTGTAITATGELVGTIKYLAPELLRGEHQSVASDIWALSCVFYELLTGRLPIDANDYGAWMRGMLDAHFQPPSALARGIPAALDALVMSGLDLEPARRLKTARHLQDQLERFRLPDSRERSASVELEAPPYPSSGFDRFFGKSRSVFRLFSDPGVPHRLMALALGLLLGALMAAVSGWRRPAAARVRVVRPVLPSPAPPAPPPIFGRWKQFEAELNYLDAKSLPRLAQRVGVDAGPDLSTWRSWVSVGHWLERPQGEPPPLQKTHSREADFGLELLIRDSVRSSFRGRPGALTAAGDLAGPSPLLLETALRNLNYMDHDGLGWLLLGRELDLEGREDLASPLYRVAFQRLGERDLGDWPHYVWTALGRGLLLAPGQDLEANYVERVIRHHGGENAWTGLAAVDGVDAAVKRGILEDGARRPATTAAASIALGEFLLRSADPDGSLAALRQGLARAPHASRLQDRILSHLVFRGNLAPAREMLARTGRISFDVQRIQRALIPPSKANPAPQSVSEPASLWRVMEVERLLEIGDRAYALTEAKRLFRDVAEPDSFDRTAAAELLGGGCMAPWIETLAEPLFAVPEHCDYLSLVGFMRRPESTPFAEKMIAALDSRNHKAAALFVRALWLSRRGLFTEALGYLKQARLQPGAIALPMLEEMEILCRPLWRKILGEPVPPAVISAIEDGGGLLDHDPFGYMKALKMKQFIALRNLTMIHYNIAPELPFWELSRAWTACQAFDSGAFAEEITSLRVSLRTLMRHEWIQHELTALERLRR